MLTASARSVCPTSPRSNGAAGASAKAEFYVCLARAFGPMRTPQAEDAFAHALADDLAQLAAHSGYDIGDAAARLAASAAAPGARPLADYSALFLVPPVPVPLNAGLYLDGGLLGRSTQAMLERYRDAGLAPDERFHDLPDHVTMQLEYLAVMFARAAEGDRASAARAREFLARFVLAWLPAFRLALHAAAQRIPAARAYEALAAILEAAARHETRSASDAEE
jgi:TorA maturation chaperone TorD